MKKVIVLTVVLMLLATTAFAAGILNTKHNLSNASGNTIRSTNYTEICVFCHTPHGGIAGGFAPLWNRSATPGDYGVGDLYNSVTLEAATNPTTVLAAVNRSDAKLCMSCHDGTNLTVGNLINPANSAGNVQPGFVAGDTVTGFANINDAASQLTNDHPIGMDYALADTTDPELVAVATVTTELTLYADSGAAGDVMWCSTCHDVHNNTYSPFLAKTNASSALCLTCHMK